MSVGRLVGWLVGSIKSVGRVPISEESQFTQPLTNKASHASLSILASGASGVTLSTDCYLLTHLLMLLAVCYSYYRYYHLQLFLLLKLFSPWLLLLLVLLSLRLLLLLVLFSILGLLFLRALLTTTFVTGATLTKTTFGTGGILYTWATLSTSPTDISLSCLLYTSDAADE